MTSHKSEKHRLVKGLLMVLGVYVCYIFLNLFNQKMHKYPYQRSDGSGSDYFREQASMNCLTSLLCTIIGFTYNTLFPPKHKTRIPYKVIGKQSALMFISSCLVNKSLNYVSFVVLSMVKSCSMISVVVVGVFFTTVKSQKNKMSSSKIVVALLVVSGTLLFQASGNKTAEESIPINQIIGFLLLFVSIIADGLLPDFQAHMKETYHPTAMEHYEQSHRYLFLIAFIVSGLSGGLSNVFYFWYSHNNVFYHCACYIISGSLGHILIFGLVRNFSQLVVPLVLALRKMLSVVISVLWFKHQLNFLQYVGVFLVFSGALYEAADKPKTVHKQIKQQTKVQ